MHILSTIKENHNFLNTNKQRLFTTPQGIVKSLFLSSPYCSVDLAQQRDHFIKRKTEGLIILNVALHLLQDHFTTNPQHLFRREFSDKAAFAGYRVDQPAPLQLLPGLLDRDDTDTKLQRSLADRRQTIAALQLPWRIWALICSYSC